MLSKFPKPFCRRPAGVLRRVGKRSARAGIWLVLTSFLLIFWIHPVRAFDPEDHRVVRVGADENFPPYEFRNEKGEPDGFNVELMRAVAEVMGLELDVRTGRWAELRKDLEAGRLDALSGMFYSRERTATYDFSVSFITVEHAVFVRADSPVKTLDDLKGKAIIVQEGDIMHDHLLVHRLTGDIVTVPDPAAALKLLAAGSHDAALIGKWQGHYLINQYGWNQLKAVGPPILPRQYCFAVQAGNLALLGRLNEGLNVVKSTGRYDEIQEKWFGIHKGISLEKISGVVLWLALALTVLLGAAWFWTWSLSKKVKEKTNRLQLELRVREEMRRLLGERNRTLKTVLEAAPVGIALVSDRVFQWVSDHMQEMTGYRKEELLGRSARLLYEGEEEFQRVGSVFYEQIRTSGFGELDTVWKRKNGSLLQVNLRSKAVDPSDLSRGVIITVLDITLRKELEARQRQFDLQMQHIQKLESLGILAGGIAHDFNNILMVILGNADLARLHLPESSGARRNLQAITQASQRAADLCRQMLAYSGKGKLVIEPVNLSQLVKEMAHMLEVSISKRAALKYHFAENLPTVEADAAQLTQVVMNLITNASEAIGECNGVISISTGAMNCDRDYVSGSYLDEELPEGLYVYIEVTDTGCGMPPEIREKIFDPFFTTKFIGRGLGLAAVSGIVRGHHGFIKIVSEPGRGTTVRVLLPAGKDQISKAVEPADSREVWSGQGLVLVVDDEESVRQVARQMIESSGLSVLAAEDGRKAVELFRQHQEEISCVLLDLTMPHMDGEETFQELRRIRKDVKVIMSTGYSEQEVAQRFVGKGLAGFIQKPYKISKLMEKIKEVMALVDD